MILIVLNVLFYILAFGSFLLFTLKAKNTLKYSITFIILGNIFYLIKLLIGLKDKEIFDNIDAILALSGNVIMLFYGILLLRFKVLQNIGFIVSFVGVIFSMANLRNLFNHNEVSYSSPIFLIHIISAAFSYAFIILGGMFSLLKLLSEKQIKQKRFQKTYVPIYTLMSIEKFAINMSFIFLTLTILFGALWSFYYNTKLYFDPRIVVIFLLWFYYAILVHIYIFRSAKPSTISLLSAVGSSITILSVVFIKHTLVMR